MNVKINAPQVEDKAWLEDILARGKKMQDKVIALEKEILETVERKIAGDGR